MILIIISLRIFNLFMREPIHVSVSKILRNIFRMYNNNNDDNNTLALESIGIRLDGIRSVAYEIIKDKFQ